MDERQDQNRGLIVKKEEEPDEKEEEEEEDCNNDSDNEDLHSRISGNSHGRPS